MPVRAELIGLCRGPGRPASTGRRDGCSVGLRDRLRAARLQLPRPLDLLDMARQRRRSRVARSLGPRSAPSRPAQAHPLAAAAAKLSPAALVAELRHAPVAGCCRRWGSYASRRFRRVLTARFEDGRCRCGKLLNSLSYEAILERGFALVSDTDGNLVRSKAAVHPGSALLAVEVADGSFGATSAERRRRASAGRSRTIRSRRACSRGHQSSFEPAGLPPISPLASDAMNIFDKSFSALRGDHPLPRRRFCRRAAGQLRALRYHRPADPGRRADVLERRPPGALRRRRRGARGLSRGTASPANSCSVKTSPRHLQWTWRGFHRRRYCSKRLPPTVDGERLPDAGSGRGLSGSARSSGRAAGLASEGSRVTSRAHWQATCAGGLLTTILPGIAFARRARRDYDDRSGCGGYRRRLGCWLTGIRKSSGSTSTRPATDGTIARLERWLSSRGHVERRSFATATLAGASRAPGSMRGPSAM